MESKEKIVNRFKELLKKEDFETYRPEIVKTIDEYKLFVENDRKEKLAAFVADGDKPEFFEMPVDEYDRTFEELHERYKAIVREKLAQKKREEEKNLEIKKELIKELKEVVENQDVIAEAFKSFNSIQERWKQVGNVPAHLFKDIQHEWRKAIEDFYYNINIYKELKINDLKKNFEKKEDLIKRMEKLLEETDIKEIEILHKAYLLEWDEIGPTFKEKWQEVRDKFYEVSNKLHDRVKAHYKGIRENQKENLAKKQELIRKLAELLDSTPDNIKAWNKLTDKVKSLQEEWKTIGFAPKNHNEKVWREFKELGNKFFEKKSEFFKGVKQVQNQVKDEKKNLIKKAKELLEELDLSDEFLDWKFKTNEWIQLQKQWKKVGSAARHEEQKLWKEFRALSDEFFKKKDEFFAGKEDRLKENLKKKKEILKKLKDWKPGDSSDKNLADLEEISDLWSKIGFVPSKDKEKLTREFAQNLSKAYAKLKVSPEEQIALAFRGKIKQLLGQKDPIAALQAERKRLSIKKSKFHDEILQLENNLSFFSSSSNENPLLNEAKKKIEGIKRIIEEIEVKIKLVNIEMNKLKKSEKAEQEQNITEGTE